MTNSISIRPSKDLRTNYAQISALTRQNPVAITVNGKEDTGVNGILWAYIAVLGAVIIGVLISLWQRFKEISKGEEEEAKKY